MNKFSDRKIRKLFKNDPIIIPDEIELAIEDTIKNLPSKNKKSFSMNKKIVFRTALILALLLLFLLPNLDKNIAHAMEKIPFFGKIFNVVTIRKHEHKDYYHDLDVKIPSINIDGDTGGQSVEFINSEIKELTDIVLKEYQKEIEEIGIDFFSSLKIDYDILNNTDSWFTLRLNIYSAAASGDLIYKIYHLDKKIEEVVILEDLFVSNDALLYISSEIKKQMIDSMEEDEDIIYWIDSLMPEWDFTVLDMKQNFYFDENNNIVIVFDKYEVAPGYMGNPEFVIAQDVYREFLKENYK